MKQFYNCLAALALTAAALATPSAFGYAAIYVEYTGSTTNHLLWIGRGDNREFAVSEAIRLCDNTNENQAGGNLDCNPEMVDGELYFLSSSDDTNPNCIAFYESRPSRSTFVPFYDNNITVAAQMGEQMCLDMREDDSETCMRVGANTADGLRNFTPCDTTGLICDSHEFANETDGECEPCTEGTHVIVGDTCTEQETCTGNFVRAPDNLATCMPCGEGLMADSDNTTCIPLPEEPEVITEFKLSVQISVTVISVTLNAIRTSENIITVTAGNKEEFAITITSGSMFTITAFNGEEILVINNGSVTGTPQSGEQDGSTAINTIVETGDDHEKTAALAAGIGLGIGAIVLGLYYFVNEHDLIVYEPGYSFSGYNDNLSYSLHNRWTATTDNWRFYWQANQTNDKFIYGSGMRYNNGILSAAMNSESEKDKTALDVDLSANKTVGLWNLGGGVNFDMAISATDTDTQNRLNAKIRYKMDKWILSANANTDGKKAAARINYIYRF